MATFGRTKLMAVAIKRFLSQVRRHAPEVYASLPEAFRSRYEPAQSQLFSDATDVEARQRSRQQAAEDLLWVIERFADQPTMTARPTYKALQAIFSQQCEVVEGKVTVRAKTGGNCIQNPSDLDATYDGHKGPGYQVQIAETWSPENEVQLITAALPQTACESDGAAVAPPRFPGAGTWVVPFALFRSVQVLAHEARPLIGRPRQQGQAGGIG